MQGKAANFLLPSGLTRDNKQRYEERLQLWRDFNHCWLALLQKQKDQSFAKAVGNDSTFHTPQTIMEIGLLTRLVDDIIRLCDRLDDMGLVDYEMGIWEEEIVSGKFCAPCSSIWDSVTLTFLLFSFYRLCPDSRWREAWCPIQESIKDAIEIASIVSDPEIRLSSITHYYYYYYYPFWFSCWCVLGPDRAYSQCSSFMGNTTIVARR